MDYRPAIITILTIPGLTSLAAATPIVLFDRSTGATISEREWMLLQPSAAEPLAADGAAMLQTLPSQSNQSGWFSHLGIEPIVPYVPINAAWPVLDIAGGPTLTIDLTLIAEEHTGNDRAGLSIIMLASDRRGIELGLWSDRLWAQEGGIAPALFTRAETSITAPLLQAPPATRRLVITQTSNGYTVTLDGVAYLSGPRRDYTAFTTAGTSLPFNPYRVPSFIFIGDNTSRAGATARISRIELDPTPLAPPAGCIADVASDSLDSVYSPNGSVGPEDLDAFIAGFIAENVAIADVASDSLDTVRNPNGAVGPEDLDAFIAGFVAGC